LHFDIIMSFLIFFLALSLMVLAHELGHFLVAKKSGVKVEEFGLGMPPQLWSKRVGETIYSINLIPMGGFVRVWGMEEAVKKEKKRAFYHQPKKVQLFILIAGVAMNFLLAVLVFSLVYGITGVPQKTGYVKVVAVAPNSPAAKAGIKEDEIVLTIEKNGERVKPREAEELIRTAKQWAGETVRLTLAAEECYPDCPGRQVELVPRKNPPSGEGAMGVVIVDTKTVKPPLWQRIPLGVWSGFKEGVFWGREIAVGVTKMIAQLFRGKVPADVAGPVGIYKTSSQIYQQSGLLAVIHFFAVVSVNLVVVNLLPLPGTDGWHVLLLGLERIRNKEINQETKRKINQAGMVFLLILFFLILLADIKRFLL